MSNRISTLVLNLIIAESKSHRQRICERITEILEAQSFDCDKIELEIKRLFVINANLYTETPTADAKKALVAVSQFHAEYYSDLAPESISAVAA